MNNFLNREWSPLDYKLITVIVFLSGIIIGFMFSPIKKGIYCGNHNGNTQITEKDI